MINFPIITPVLILIVMIVIALETLFLWRWNPYLFRYGVPIYFKKHEVSLACESLYDCRDSLAAVFDDWKDPELEFKIFSDAECAFRRKIEIRPTTYRDRSWVFSNVTHGILRYDPQRGVLSFVGYLNLYSILLLLVLGFAAFQLISFAWALLVLLAAGVYLTLTKELQNYSNIEESLFDSLNMINE